MNYREKAVGLRLRKIFHLRKGFDFQGFQYTEWRVEYNADFGGFMHILARIAQGNGTGAVFIATPHASDEKGIGEKH